MTFRNQAFTDTTVDLDGNEYFQCKMTRCKLRYRATGPFTLESSTLTECQWVFDEAATRTLQFMAVLYKLGFKDQVEAIFDQIRSPSLQGPPSGAIQ